MRDATKRYFHTIKSILNIIHSEANNNPLPNFHTIKSILNQLTHHAHQ